MLVLCLSFHDKQKKTAHSLSEQVCLIHIWVCLALCHSASNDGSWIPAHTKDFWCQWSTVCNLPAASQPLKDLNTWDYQHSVLCTASYLSLVDLRSFLPYSEFIEPAHLCQYNILFLFILMQGKDLLFNVFSVQTICSLAKPRWHALKFIHTLLVGTFFFCTN